MSLMYANPRPALQHKLTIYQDKRFEVQQKTTFEEFLALMQNDRRTANIDRDALSLIFERVRHIIYLDLPSC